MPSLATEKETISIHALREEGDEGNEKPKE